MHELTIAKNIVEIAEEEAKRHQAKQINKIVLEIGLLAGVEFDALEFAWSEAVNGTLLENAICEIIKIKGKARCDICNSEFELEDFFGICPNCQSFENEVLEGKELKIKSLEIEKLNTYKNV